MSKDYITLKPIKESPEDYDAIERRIRELFKKEIYFPLLAALGAYKRTLTNAQGGLAELLRTGRITFSRGVFSGRFDAASSKELKALGASWDKKRQIWKLTQSQLPPEIRQLIGASEVRFQERLDLVDRKLAQVLPDAISEKLRVSDIFDKTLWKTDRSFQESVKGIVVAPELTPERRKRISDEWQTNLRLWIQDFTQKEILELRKDMRKTVFSGDRYGSVIRKIQTSYGVTFRKAKFLARQETALLMTKYKQVRYQEAGLDEYHWHHVSGTAAHPVRPIHKALGDARGPDGSKKIYRWSQPPIVDDQGNRKNPGQDYNCRCIAIPVVRFKR